MARKLELLAAFMTCVSVAASAWAAPITFDLQWSGAPFGNAAQAFGTATIEESLLPNPTPFTFLGFFPSSVLTDFQFTVSGASSGNGTFSSADYAAWVWDTNGGVLDLSQELVGQPTNGAPWGTSTLAGNFNLTFRTNPAAPTTNAPFQFTPAGSTDTLMLVSFAPQQAPAAVPEPTSIAVWGIALVGIGLGAAVHRRLRHRSA